MEKCPEFCLGGGCCCEFEDGANDVEETVEFNGFVFLEKGRSEVNSGCATACFGHGEVGCITMYI